MTKSPDRMSNVELKARALSVLFQEYRNNSPLQTTNSLSMRIKGRTIGHMRMKRILEECLVEGTVEKKNAGGNAFYCISEIGIRNISEIINAFKALGYPVD